MIEDLVLEAIKDHRALQKFGELLFLADEVAKIRPEVIVEIGSDAGGTLWLWTKLFPYAKIISIDLPNGPFSSGIPLDDDIRAERYIGDSHNPSTKFWLKERTHGRGGVGAIDFLFIDGDHTAGGVAQDLQDYSPLCKVGGIVALHDIVEHPANALVGVHKVWKQIEDQGFHHHQLITQPTNWGGIGVVYL